MDNKELITEGRFGDLLVVAVIVKKVLKPIEKSKAFHLGLIDKKGKRIRKPETIEEKNAYTVLDKFVFKIKKLLGHRITALSTFLLLLSGEEYSEERYDLLMEEFENITNSNLKKRQSMLEEFERRKHEW